MTDTKRNEEKVLYLIGWIGIAFLLLLELVHQMFPGIGTILTPCIFHALTGFYCPGCGGTRAVAALTGGSWIKSLFLHPIVIYTLVIGGWFMISQSVERLSRGRYAIGMKYRDRYLWLALGIIAFNFVLKNIFLLLGIDLLVLLS